MPRSGPGQSILGATLLIASLAISAANLRAQGDAADAAATADEERVVQTRTALERWVETRRVISREKRDWVLGRQVLQDRIDLVLRETESLRTRIDEAEQSISAADDKKTELAAEKARSDEATSALHTVVTDLETRTKALIAKLPTTFQERVQVFAQRIPDDAGRTERSLGERFQNVVGILSAVNRFNREITMTSEVRELGDGTSAEVTAVYIGLGQGYYVNNKGDAAGIGNVSASGWVWTPMNAAAPAVARLVKIMQSEEGADFVPLPLEIR